jgi:hypothetical protein
MSEELKNRQSTDSDQGGEGTNSLNGKSYDFLSKDISNVENTEDGGKPLDDHTR